MNEVDPAAQYMQLKITKKGEIKHFSQNSLSDKPQTKNMKIYKRIHTVRPMKSETLFHDNNQSPLPFDLQNDDHQKGYNQSQISKMNVQYESDVSVKVEAAQEDASDQLNIKSSPEITVGGTNVQALTKNGQHGTAEQLISGKTQTYSLFNESNERSTSQKNLDLTPRRLEKLFLNTKSGLNSFQNGKLQSLSPGSKERDNRIQDNKKALQNSTEFDIRFGSLPRIQEDLDLGIQAQLPFMSVSQSATDRFVRYDQMEEFSDSVMLQVKKYTRQRRNIMQRKNRELAQKREQLTQSAMEFANTVNSDISPKKIKMKKRKLPKNHKMKTIGDQRQQFFSDSIDLPKDKIENYFQNRIQINSAERKIEFKNTLKAQSNAMVLDSGSKPVFTDPSKTSIASPRRQIGQSIAQFAPDMPIHDFYRAYTTHQPAKMESQFGNSYKKQKVMKVVRQKAFTRNNSNRLNSKQRISPDHKIDAYYENDSNINPNTIIDLKLMTSESTNLREQIGEFNRRAKSAKNKGMVQQKSNRSRFASIKQFNNLGENYSMIEIPRQIALESQNDPKALQFKTYHMKKKKLQPGSYQFFKSQTSRKKSSGSSVENNKYFNRRAKSNNRNSGIRIQDDAIQFENGDHCEIADEDENWINEDHILISSKQITENDYHGKFLQRCFSPGSARAGLRNMNFNYAGHVQPKSQSGKRILTAYSRGDQQSLKILKPVIKGKKYDNIMPNTQKVMGNTEVKELTSRFNKINNQTVREKGNYTEGKQTLVSLNDWTSKQSSQNIWMGGAGSGSQYYQNTKYNNNHALSTFKKIDKPLNVNARRQLLSANQSLKRTSILSKLVPEPDKFNRVYMVKKQQIQKIAAPYLKQQINRMQDRDIKEQFLQQKKISNPVYKEIERKPSTKKCRNKNKKMYRELSINQQQPVVFAMSQTNNMDEY